MIEFDNKLTKHIWLPQEPRLFMIYSGSKFVPYDASADFEGYSDDEDEDEEMKDQVFDLDGNNGVSDPRTHSEKISLKEIHNINQEILKSTGIYMLDYESEVFIWIGSNVKKTVIPHFAGAAGQAMTSINSKGAARMRKITLSMIWQGDEPLAFTNAFKKWEPFPKQGLVDEKAEISEEGSSGDGLEESDLEDNEDTLKNVNGVEKALLLDKKDLYRISTMLPSEVWIN